MKKELDFRIKRLLIIAGLGLIYTAYLIYDLVWNEFTIWIAIITGCLFISSIIFLVMGLILKNKQKK